MHFTSDYPTSETVFRIIISANQLSIYGAVAAVCEEFEDHQDRTGEPGQHLRSEKKWYSSENSPQGAWDNIAEEMLLEFAESGHPIFRATTPLSRGQLKSKGRGKLSIHFAADQDPIDTIYRIILSVNQLSVYGAVAAICEEFENHQGGSGKPEILMGQSIVLGEIKAEALLHDENPVNDQIIWQQYIQQVESLSPENKLSKFCKEAGFMRVVEVGQYFVT